MREDCWRKRWLEYECPNEDVGGFVPDKLDMNLTVGSAFHVGVNFLLSGFGVDDAIIAALEGTEGWEGYWPLVRNRGFILEETEDQGFVYEEQAALVEALIRGYAYYALPQLLENYEVLETEREERARMEDEDFILYWGARTDALLRKKDSGELIVLSLKTAKMYGAKDAAQVLHDMQGLSECWAVEQRLRYYHAKLKFRLEQDKKGVADDLLVDLSDIPQWYVDHFRQGGLPTVSGVKMEYALKGERRESPMGSGRWVYYNALISPWVKDDCLGEPQYAIQYDFQDASGANRRLGKGFNKTPIWQKATVKDWIQYVATESIQDLPPMTAIEKQFVLPDVIFRNEDDILEWTQSVHAGERELHHRRAIIYQAMLDGVPLERLNKLLNQLFPKSTKRCDWPVKCQFQPICFGAHGGAYNFAPAESGQFAPRKSNHRAAEIQSKGKQP